MGVEEAKRPQYLGKFLNLRRSELSEVLSVQKITQNQMAERANIGIGWYRVIEQGRAKNVSLKVLDQLAEACFLNSAERKLFLYAYSSPDIADIVCTLDSQTLRR